MFVCQVPAVTVKLFPGEPLDSFVGSKVAELAEALLERRLAKGPVPEALTERERWDAWRGIPPSSEAPKQFSGWAPLLKTVVFYAFIPPPDAFIHFW